jgi:hypothetical protein
MSSGTTGQITLDFSGCGGGILAGSGYTCVLVSDWGETAFTGLVYAQ